MSNPSYATSEDKKRTMTLEQLVAFLGDLQKQSREKEKLADPDSLSAAIKQATRIKNDKELLKILGKDCDAESLRKYLNACIEALFEVEKFQRGAAGKQAQRGGASAKQLHAVLTKKLRKAGLPLEGNPVPEILKKLQVRPEVSASVLELKKPKELAKKLLETAARPNAPSGMRPLLEKLAALLPDNSFLKNDAAISESDLNLFTILYIIYILAVVVFVIMLILAIPHVINP